MKLIFMGSAAFGLPALRALAGSRHKIAAVYTQGPKPAGRGHGLRKTPIHGEAERLGLPVFTPASLKGREAAVELAAHKADAAAVAAYGLLLPQTVLDLFPRGCLNIHPSLLPRWRGAAPVQRPVMAGDTETGVCIMLMDAGLDTGPLLAVERMDMPPRITAGELHDILAGKGAALLLDTLERMENGLLEAMPQNTSGATYAAKLTKEDGRIDWRRPARELDALIRGVTPAPGAYFTRHGEMVKVLAAVWLDYPGAEKAAPGTVLKAGMELTVACGQGALRLLRLQRPGRNPLDAAEFLRGAPVAPGEVLTTDGGL